MTAELPLTESPSSNSRESNGKTGVSFEDLPQRTQDLMIAGYRQRSGGTEDEQNQDYEVAKTKALELFKNFPPETRQKLADPDKYKELADDLIKQQNELKARDRGRLEQAASGKETQRNYGVLGLPNLDNRLSRVLHPDSGIQNVGEKVEFSAATMAIKPYDAINQSIDLATAAPGTAPQRSIELWEPPNEFITESDARFRTESSRGGRFEGLRRRIQEMAAKLGRIDARELLVRIKDNPELVQSLAISGAITIGTLVTGPISVAGIGLGGALSIGIREFIGRRQVAKKGEQVEAFRKVFGNVTSNKNKYFPELNYFTDELGAGDASTDVLEIGPGNALVVAENPAEQKGWRKRLGKMIGIAGEILTAPEKAAALIAIGPHNAARRLERSLPRQESGSLAVVNDIKALLEMTRGVRTPEAAHALNWNQFRLRLSDSHQALKDLMLLDVMGNNVPQTMLERINPGVQAFDRSVVNPDSLNNAMRQFVALNRDPNFFRELSATVELARVTGDEKMEKLLSDLMSTINLLATPESLEQSRVDQAKRLRTKVMFAQVFSSVAKGAVGALIASHIRGVRGEGSVDSTRRDIPSETSAPVDQNPSAPLRDFSAETNRRVLRPIENDSTSPTLNTSTVEVAPPTLSPEFTPPSRAEILTNIPTSEFLSNRSVWDNLGELYRSSEASPNTYNGVVNLIANTLKVDNAGQFVAGPTVLTAETFNALRNANVMPRLSEITQLLDARSAQPGFAAFLRENPELNAFWLVGRGGVDNNVALLSQMKNVVTDSARIDALLTDLKTKVSA